MTLRLHGNSLPPRGGGRRCAGARRGRAAGPGAPGRDPRGVGSGRDMNAAALDAAALIDGVAHGDVRASMRGASELGAP